MVSFIPKKCLVCHYIPPSEDVLYCPSCGTELQTILEVSNVSSKDSHSVNDQIEPLYETNLSKSFKIHNATNHGEFAWIVNDNPLSRVKKIQTHFDFHSLATPFSFIPFTNIWKEKVLSFLFSLVISFLLLIEVGLIGSILFSGINFFLLFSLLFIFDFVRIFFTWLSKTTLLFMMRSHYSTLSIQFSKNSFSKYFVLQTVKTLGLVLGFLTIFHFVSLVFLDFSQIVSIYLSLTALLFLFYPFFTVLTTSQMLSLIRKNGVMQELLDGCDIFKYNFKKTIERSLTSFFVPFIVIMGTFTTITKFTYSFLSPSIVTFLFVDLIISLFALSLLFAFNFAMRYKMLELAITYELEFQQRISPPALKWIETGSSPKEQDYVEKNETIKEEESEVCPVCSSFIIEGATFCIDCGSELGGNHS